MGPDQHVGAPEPVDGPAAELEREAHRLREVAELEMAHEGVALDAPAAGDGLLHLALRRETAVVRVLDCHATGNRPRVAPDQRGLQSPAAGGGASGDPLRTMRKIPSTSPSAPTHIRTTPHVWRLNPSTWAVTAYLRIAPTAI